SATLRQTRGEAGIDERELARLALVGSDALPDRPVKKRPSGTRKIDPASSRWDLRLLVTAKLRRGYGGMARRASGFVARVADGDNTAHQLRKYLFVFRDMD